MTALVRFELVRRLRGGRLGFALVLVSAGAVALGWGVQSGRLIPSESGSLYGTLLILALALVFRFDLAHDMDHGVADLLAPNLLSTRTFVAARILAGLAALFQFALPAAALTALVPGLGPRFAFWHVGLWTLVAILTAPAVLAAEFWLRTRLPGLAVALLGLVVVFVSVAAGGYPAVSSTLGIQGLVPGSFRSLAGLAWRAALVGVAGLALVGPLALRHWGPGGSTGRR